MRTRILSFIISGIVLLTAGLVLLQAIPQTEYFQDETPWITSSYYYASLLSNHNFNTTDWEGGQFYEWGSKNNLHLGHYLLGLPLKLYLGQKPGPFATRYLPYFADEQDFAQLKVNTPSLMNGLRQAGYIEDNNALCYKALILSNPSQLDINNNWADKKYDIYTALKNAAVNKPHEIIYEKNLSLGNVQPKDILYITRLNTTIFSLLCCVLLLTISLLCGNILAGALAICPLILQPSFITFSTQAMTDIHYVFFLLSLCLAAIALPFPKKPIFFSILIGILIGFATSIKTYAFIISEIFFFLYLLYLAQLRCLTYKKTVVCYMTALITSLATIYIINPSMWGSAYPSSLFAIFMAQKNFSKILALFVSHWQEPNRLWEISKNIIFSFKSFHIEPALLTAAIIANIVSITASLRKRQFNPQAVLFLFFLSIYIYYLCFMTLNWGRFYLPIIFASQLLTALFIYNGIRFLITNIRLMRPKQILKNIFVLFPLIFAQKLFLIQSIERSLEAFFIFFLASGAVYIYNDIVDQENDSLHPVKKSRPIASGAVSIIEGKKVMLIFAFSAILFSFFLTPLSAIIICIYFILNILYSLFLKKIFLIDAACISIFFVLRIVAGSAAIKVRVSRWIIAATLIATFMISLGKRSSESRLLGKGQQSLLNVLFTISAIAACVCYTLYATNPAIINKFHTNNIIYTIPFVYFGILRYAIITIKHRADSDLSELILTDKPLAFCLISWLLSCIAAIYF